MTPRNYFIYVYYFSLVFTIVAGFGIYRKYEDISSGLIDIGSIVTTY